MQIFGGNPDNLEERLGRWLLVKHQTRNMLWSIMNWAYL